MRMKPLLLIVALAPFINLSGQNIDSLKIQKQDLEFEILALELDIEEAHKKIKDKKSEVAKLETLIKEVNTSKEREIKPVALKDYYTTSKDAYLFSHPNSDEGGKLINKRSRVYVRELAENNFYEVSYKGLVGYLKRDVISVKEKKEVKLNTSPAAKSTYKYSTSSSSYTKPKRRTTTYRRYIRGPRGGCYYINSNGNKTYVDRSKCN